VALLPLTDLDGAAELAERLRAGIRGGEVSVAGGVLQMTACFGCTELLRGGNTHLDMLAAADKALYQGKRSGRDRVVRSALMNLSAEAN